MRSIALTLIFAFCVTTPAVSSAGTFLGLEREEISDVSRQMVYKLGNGIFDSLFGFAEEIPFNMINEVNEALYEERNVALAYGFTGPLIGFGCGLARTLTGIFEVGTFAYTFDFEPVMTPVSADYLTFGRDRC